MIPGIGWRWEDRRSFRLTKPVFFLGLNLKCGNTYCTYPFTMGLSAWLSGCQKDQNWKASIMARRSRLFFTALPSHRAVVHRGQACLPPPYWEETWVRKSSIWDFREVGEWNQNWLIFWRNWTPHCFSWIASPI